MALQGNLETFQLSSVLQLLSADRKTGILTFADKDKKVQVFIKAGNIVYAIGTQKEVRLGYLLRTKGIISAEELQKALTLAKQKKERLGKILVEKGYISLETLKKFLHQQVRDILYDLFLWQQGDFKYADQDIKLDEEFMSELNYMEVILEGTRRVDEWSILKKNIPNQQVVFRISRDVQDKKDTVDLTANEWRVISMVDGKRTVKQIIADSGHDEFIVYRVLNSLISSGLIEKSESGTAAAPPSTSATTEAQAVIQAYHAVLQSMVAITQKAVGDRALSLFEEAKAEMAEQKVKPLRAYDCGKDLKTNVTQLFKGATGPPPSGEVLLNAFSAWIPAILHKLKGVLKEPDMKACLQLLTNPGSAWQKLLGRSPVKDKILASINRAVEQFSQEFAQEADAKEKSSGILSFLKRK